MSTTSIGRIVHFAHEHGCRPAQILSVFDQGSGPPLLNLVVTLDGYNDTKSHDAPLHAWETSIPHADVFADDAGIHPQRVPDTWHWPEQV